MLAFKVLGGTRTETKWLHPWPVRISMKFTRQRRYFLQLVHGHQSHGQRMDPSERIGCLADADGLMVIDGDCCCDWPMHKGGTKETRCWRCGMFEPRSSQTTAPPCFHQTRGLCCFCFFLGLLSCVFSCFFMFFPLNGSQWHFQWAQRRSGPTGCGLNLHVSLSFFQNISWPSILYARTVRPNRDRLPFMFVFMLLFSRFPGVIVGSMSTRVFAFS